MTTKTAAIERAGDIRRQAVADYVAYTIDGTCKSLQAAIRSRGTFAMHSAAGEPLEQKPIERALTHIPGAILPHGAMLVIDADSFEILQAGGDTAALLGASAGALLHTSIASLFQPL